jgi:hypothetical protein
MVVIQLPQNIWVTFISGLIPSERFAVTLCFVCEPNCVFNFLVLYAEVTSGSAYAAFRSIDQLQNKQEVTPEEHEVLGGHLAMMDASLRHIIGQQLNVTL